MALFLPRQIDREPFCIDQRDTRDVWTFHPVSRRSNGPARLKAIFVMFMHQRPTSLREGYVSTVTKRPKIGAAPFAVLSTLSVPRAPHLFLIDHPNRSESLTMTTPLSADTVNIDTYNEIAGNSTNVYFNFPIAGPSSAKTVALCPSFNDAPLDLLCVNFTGRETEMALIIEFLDTLYGDVPTRCAVHGMHGVGKSQLFYALAKDLYDKGRYTNVFWMQATTIEKLHQGFSKLLHLVSHPDRSSTDDNARLTSARRWLEDFDTGRWLLVIDNVARETVDFLRQHLPRKNGRGNILFTTRTEDVAKALTNVAGKRHGIVELRIPDVEDAAKLFLKHLDDPETPTDASKIREVVKGIGCLPLAVAQAASYMTGSGSSLDDMLSLFKSERIIDVRLDSTHPIPVGSCAMLFRSSSGRTTCPVTRRNPLQRHLVTNSRISKSDPRTPSSC